MRFSGKRGLVISLDAFIALLLFLSLFVAITLYLGKVEFKAQSSVMLKETAMDSLSVLEKQGLLERAIARDRAAPIRAFLNRLPYRICADLRVYSQEDLNNVKFLVLRQDCKKTFEDFATVKRSVVVDENGNAGLYYAEMLAWYRKG